ncbi:hypothetical protein HY031_02345 [Candidatus Gottesmanbacteria bacterium]|nr:hypothetical protein [Candidatus Gottesmanbacteria bacterium]
MPKAEELERLAQSLKNIASAGGAQGTKAERVLEKVETREARTWIEKFTNRERPAQQEDDRRRLTAEAERAYWGTNWLELTDEAATYQRNLIDETVNQAQKLAVNASGYEHFAALREEGAFWDMIDDRPDIYRTQRLEKLKKNASQEEKDKHNALEEELREFQIRIDNRHRYGISPEEELRLLLEERDKLSDLSVGRNAQLSNREVDLYLKKLSKKIEKLRVHLEQERQASAAEAGGGGRRVGPQNPYEERVASRVQSAVESIRKSMAVLTPKEIDEIRGALTSTTNKAIAEEIFALPDKITRQQLEDLFAKLNSTNAYDEIINSLSQGGRRRLGTKEVWGVIDKEAETILRLQNFLTSKVFNLSEFSISSSVWGRPEGAVAAEAIATLQLGDIGEHGSEKLDKIFFQTLLRSADTDPHAVWDKAYDIFKQSDRHIFYALLETRLGELGLSMDQIKQVVGIYTQHYELKEIHHNLISIIETRQEGARETVQKYLGSYKDE